MDLKDKPIAAYVRAFVLGVSLRINDSYIPTILNICDIYRPFFLRLPWQDWSPLHFAIDPATELWLPPMRPEDYEVLGEGKVTVRKVLPTPPIPGYVWVGDAFNKKGTRYETFPLEHSDWAIPKVRILLGRPPSFMLDGCLLVDSY